jgi:hypothetical protein
MWWKSQNLDKPIRDKNGHIWHFLIWSDFPSGVHTQRIYFWDGDKNETGVVELSGDQTLHITQLKKRIAKLATNPEYRRQFRCKLSFPIERHYG